MSPDEIRDLIEPVEPNMDDEITLKRGDLKAFLDEYEEDDDDEQEPQQIAEPQRCGIFVPFVLGLAVGVAPTIFGFASGHFIFLSQRF